ncbi:hypothetical protein DIPPA_17232 [Diplonema papillatum]|nr:hypothetical protein DIPPA_17232 [Diplonema papillatum]
MRTVSAPTVGPVPVTRRRIHTGSPLQTTGSGTWEPAVNKPCTSTAGRAAAWVKADPWITTVMFKNPTVVFSGVNQRYTV